MTIDELLAMAREYCVDADQEAGINESMRFALVAQACATTAQAMILAQACAIGPEVSYLRVDTGN